jgi:hypothetical protein
MLNQTLTSRPRAKGGYIPVCSVRGKVCQGQGAGTSRQNHGCCHWTARVRLVDCVTRAHEPGIGIVVKPSRYLYESVVQRNGIVRNDVDLLRNSRTVEACEETCCLLKQQPPLSKSSIGVVIPW